MAAKTPQELANLPKGWDGYDGIAPTAAALATADNLQWVPGSDGSLQAEIHAGGADLEISIAPDGTLRSVMFERVR